MAQGNFARVWGGASSGGVGYEFSSEVEEIDYKYRQMAANTGVQNTGFHAVSPGALDSTLKLAGYRQHTAGSVHRLLSAAAESEWVILAALGETATPAFGDLCIGYVGSRSQYDLPQDYENPMRFDVPLVSRGIAVPPLLPLLYLNEATKTATNVDGAEYDEGSASVGLAYGGIAFCAIWGITGGDTYNITVKSATSSGGSFSTLCTFSGVGASLMVAYSQVSIGTTINRYKKVNVALASGAGTSQTFKVAVAFAPFYNL